MSYSETYKRCEACVGTGLVFDVIEGHGDLTGCPVCKTAGGLIERTVIDYQPAMAPRTHPALAAKVAGR